MRFPDTFVFSGLPSRVVFGTGTLARTGAEVGRLGRHRALVLSTPGHEPKARALIEQLGGIGAGVFAGAAMHTPVNVTEAALAAYSDAGADCVVALGGGSTIGLGKAIATRTGADQVVIPTTYAGSEMTDILGETAEGSKTTRRDLSILPETVIYDVDLTLSLPKKITVSSALNSLAHAAEALYATDRNPVVSLMAVESIRTFVDALPRLVAAPRDHEARTAALRAAWLSSAALGSVAMALHHKICHALGGAFNTPHAETHAIMLPHTIGYNAAAVPDLLAPMSEILGATPGAGLFDLAQNLDAPTRLEELGLTEADLDRAAEIAASSPYPNPRSFDRPTIRALLQDAWLGTPPPV